MAKGIVETEKYIQRFGLLNRWNFALAGLYLLQGLAIIIFGNNRSFPVNVGFLANDPLRSYGAGHSVLSVATRHVFDINITYVIVVIFLISFLFHGLMATVYRSQYERTLERGINKFRWIEYCLSVGLMIVAVGLLVGVSDLATLAAMFGLTVIMNLLGLITEIYGPGKNGINRFMYWTGAIAGIIPWVVISIYLISGIVYGASLSGFVYGIFVSLFILFGCFMANMYMRYSRIGKWKDYMYSERVYMALSLLAKTAFAWLIFAGIIH